MDPAKARLHFVNEVARHLANKQIVDGFKNTGNVVPFDRTRILAPVPRHTPANLQLRQIKVPALGPAQMAPYEVATLIERAYGGAGQEGVLAVLDQFVATRCVGSCSGHGNTGSME